MPNMGIMIASNASEGIVCNSPQRLKTIFEIPALSYANRLMARPKNEEQCQSRQFKMPN